MRWAFWRSRSTEPPRALPDDVGLPTGPRPPAATKDRGPDDADPSDGGRQPAPRTSGATPTDAPPPAYDAPLTAPAPDVDRAALAAAGGEVAQVVGAVLADGSAGTATADARTLAVAATGALAARLPALSGVDAGVLDEPEDELLHAYADLLVTRAQHRSHDREDLLAVAHVAAAAAAVDAAGEPALLLLAGVRAEAQLHAAAVLLAQTAEDGGGSPDRLQVEVRELFSG